EMEERRGGEKGRKRGRRGGKKRKNKWRGLKTKEGSGKWRERVERGAQQRKEEGAVSYRDMTRGWEEGLEQEEEGDREESQWRERDWWDEEIREGVRKRKEKCREWRRSLRWGGDV